MLPSSEHVHCDLSGHIHAFTVVPPVPSNLRKWAVDRAALEVHGNAPRHAHGDMSSLALHGRLPEVLVVPREKTPTPGESQGRGSLMGCRLWGRTESDTTEAT